MIEHLELKHIGPASSMKMEFSPRLNILTGDNGLGKTFIMDIAWFVLTRTWPNLPVLPQRGKGIEPEINFLKSGQKKLSSPLKLSYSYKTQKWLWDSYDLPPDGLVLYARADGGVSIWDQAKNSAQRTDVDDGPDKHFSTEAIHFDAKNIFDGISQKDKVKCNGLIRDWVNWQFQKKGLFNTFSKVLEILSPNTLEIIRPGEPTRIFVDDAREIPTVNLPYGNVPVTHISAGMRRVLSLAYLMVWAWNEHLAASSLINQEPTDRFVILFDEVEAHLHPQWQRSFMPALLEVIKILESSLKVQIIASTHAPLVLASLETEFCEDKDKILNFELTKDSVSINEIPWVKQGDVVNWLVSESFGLQQARSRDAELAIEAAEAFMRDDIEALPESLDTKDIIHKELLRVLIAAAVEKQGRTG
ncbi:AAA family ATPase [Desulfobacterales bacterium HSG16]|nr:AAA family ATPase [Desulfobacterales bacterium HSG16]